MAIADPFVLGVQIITDGEGTLFLSDDGTYRPAAGGPGNGGNVNSPLEDDLITGAYSIVSGADDNLRLNVDRSGADTAWVWIDGVRWPETIGSDGYFLKISSSASRHLEWAEVPTSPVDVSGTPAANQITMWTNANTIQASGISFTNNNLNLPPSGTIEGRDLDSEFTRLDGMEDGAQANVFNTASDIDHDKLDNYVAEHHIDWTADQSATYTFHANNIPGVTNVSNSQLAEMNAFTIKVNAINGASNPQDLDLSTLTGKTTPVGADILWLWDSADATNRWKSLPISNLPTGAGEANAGEDVPLDKATAPTVSVYAGMSSTNLTFHQLHAPDNPAAAGPRVALSLANDGTGNYVSLDLNEGNIDHDSLLNRVITQHREHDDSLNPGDANEATTLWSVQRIQTQIDNAVAGIASGINFIAGGYNATTNVPDLTGNLPGAVSQGDFYVVNTPGNSFYGVALDAGDQLIANIDDPAVVGDWTVINLEQVEATVTEVGITRFAAHSDATIYTPPRAVQNTDPRLATVNQVGVNLGTGGVGVFAQVNPGNASQLEFYKLISTDSRFEVSLNGPSNHIEMKLSDTLDYTDVGLDANQVVDHSTIEVNGGRGLSGGGDLTSDRTLNISFSAANIDPYGTSDTFTSANHLFFVWDGNRMESYSVPFQKVIDDAGLITSIPPFNQAIEDLNNVTVTTPADGNILQYNLGNARWENAEAAAFPLEDLTNVVATPAFGRMLVYEGTASAWVNGFEYKAGDVISSASPSGPTPLYNWTAVRDHTANNNAGHIDARPSDPGSTAWSQRGEVNNWWHLSPGTAGQVLTSRGTGNALHWTTPAQGSGDMAESVYNPTLDPGQILLETSTTGTGTTSAPQTMWDKVIPIGGTPPGNSATNQIQGDMAAWNAQINRDDAAADGFVFTENNLGTPSANHLPRFTGTGNTVTADVNYQFTTTASSAILDIGEPTSGTASITARAIRFNATTLFNWIQDEADDTWDFRIQVGGHFAAIYDSSARVWDFKDTANVGETSVNAGDLTIDRLLSPVAVPYLPLPSTQNLTVNTCFLLTDDASPYLLPSAHNQGDTIRVTQESGATPLSITIASQGGQSIYHNGTAYTSLLHDWDAEILFISDGTDWIVCHP